MPSTKKAAVEEVDNLLFYLRSAVGAAEALNRPLRKGGRNALWRCLSARREDESPLISEADRTLLRDQVPAEIVMAANRIMAQVGFVTGSQSHSDEKPAEES